MDSPVQKREPVQKPEVFGAHAPVPSGVQAQEAVFERLAHAPFLAPFQNPLGFETVRALAPKVHAQGVQAQEAN
jgi:hypothetical protein